MAAPTPLSAADRYQDILIFDRDRPFFLRLDIRAEGQPHAQLWLADVRRQVAALDTDGDGALTKAETQAAATDDAPAASLVRMPRLWDADIAPFDGRLTAEELAALARSRGAGAFQFETADKPLRDKALLGQGLFATLDRDADGRFTAAELTAAGESFRRIDFDEDGTISLEELQSADVEVSSARSLPALPGVPIISLSPDRSVTDLVQQIRGRYATGTGGVLGPQQIGLEPPVFERFDADHDGRLDFDELRYLLRHPVPTLVLTVRLGNAEQKSPRITVGPTATEAAVAVRTSDAGLVSIVLDIGQIELRCLQPAGDEQVTSGMQAHFQGLDRDANQYLELKEVASDRLIGPAFAAFDRDGNGKLYEEELLAVFAESLQNARRRTLLTAADRGRDLFEILDADGNSRVGPGEFGAIAARIALWDDDGDGAIASAEVPHLFQLALGPARPSVGGSLLPIAMGTMTARGPDEIPVPSWFGRMDRNEDGGISAGEFLGTSQAFDEIDRNGDGLIRPGEAVLVGR